MHEEIKLIKLEIIKYIRRIIICLAIFALIIVMIPFIADSISERIMQNRLRAEFVYDFDYMLNFLEENFPLLGIIYRRNGVDMLELGIKLRNYLAYEADRNIITHEYFWTLLRDEFFDRAFPVGHLWLITDTSRDWDLARLADIEIHPWFYENTDVGFGRFYYIYRTAPRYGFYREQPRTFPRRQLSPGTVLYTRILEEGRIAYLGVTRLPAQISDEQFYLIDEFYREIADFEHLIIDMRGNTGGFINFFNYLIAAPLIDRTQTVTFYHFFKAGQFNIDSFRLRNVRSRILRTINFYYFFGDISDELMADLLNTDLFFEQRHRISPRSPEADFNGKIWMLIDEYVFSAAQWVASAYKTMGFATFVGETTGGMIGSYVYQDGSFDLLRLMLPNTGFIIRFDNTLMMDLTGRPLEYGTEPHFFNRPGLDALETVLQMIYENTY